MNLTHSAGQGAEGDKRQLVDGRRQEHQFDQGAQCWAEEGVLRGGVGRKKEMLDRWAIPCVQIQFTAWLQPTSSGSTGSLTRNMIAANDSCRGSAMTELITPASAARVYLTPRPGRAGAPRPPGAHGLLAGPGGASPGSGW